MSYKPKGYGKSGRPSKKDKQKLGKKIKDIKFAKALIESNSLTDAYLKTHPKSSKKSASINVYRVLKPEVIETLKELLQLEKIAVTNREMIEKILQIVIAKWVSKEERTNDMLKAIDILTKLVPEFKERIGVEDLSQLPETEVNARLKLLGVDPDNVGLN